MEMANYDLFYNRLDEVSGRFRNIDKNERIRLISHHDADGICSASIMIDALKREGFIYEASIIKQLSEEVLIGLEKEPDIYYVFTDLGAGQYELIKKYLNKKIILILDHHSFDLEILKDIPGNIDLVNPHSFGLDGSMEISGAGVVFMFAKALNDKNRKNAYLALVGALGDTQEKEGFIGMNREILKIAIEEKNIRVEKGLKWFGLETKSLVYLMTFNSDPYIPGISGSESKAIEFMVSLGIDPKSGNNWKKYNDLEEHEKATLISGIVMKRSSEKNPEDILADRYILIDEPESSPFRDLKEFSTLLNACGRMDKADLGIGVCLGDEDIKKKALETLGDYKKEIISALRWYEEEKNEDIIYRGKKYIIINAKDKVMPSIIGTLASIISNSEELGKGTIILSLAHDMDGATKVSIRVSGKGYEGDLREIVNAISDKVSGQSGGHKNAAGAIIKTSEEDRFVEEAKKYLDSLNI